ncbi:unnamed protein product [Orchesella dallaii]|uniref:Uncharacterized protein n=1 Tax=Orchesella dallaii TaxID=48710 RepID=A0ABP1QN91_9HEXA
MSKFWRPTLVPLVIVMSSTIWIVAASFAKPEKIFRHDRLAFDPQKLPRVDLDNEELQRALEDLRRRVPEYTGYLFVDIVFEIFKMLFIFLLRLLGQQQDPAPE